MRYIYITKPILIEKQYKNLLIKFVNDINNICVNEIFNTNFRHEYQSYIRTDDINDSFEVVKTYLKIKTSQKYISTINIIENLFNKVDDFSKNLFINKLSRRINLKDATIKKTWLAENVSLIKSIETRYLDSVATAVNNAILNKTSSAKLAEDIRKIKDVGYNRARLIARDQIAKAFGSITRDRNLQAGITTYKWQTAKDQRVRDTHNNLNDKICSWEDNTIYKDSVTSKKWEKRKKIKAVEKHPSMDFQCRCTSIAIINFDL